MNISYSFLSKMRECPFRASQKVPANPLWVAKGNIIHEALESRKRRGGSVEKNLDLSVLGTLEYGSLAESTMRRFGATNPRQYIENQVYIAARWLDTELPLSRLSRHEVELSSVWKGCRVVGHLDIVDGKDIFDIKITTSKAYVERLQASMYLWLCHMNDLDVNQFNFVFPLLGKIEKVEPDYAELFRLMNEASIYIKSEKYPAFPANCEGCALNCPLFRKGA